MAAPVAIAGLVVWMSRSGRPLQSRHILVQLATVVAFASTFTTVILSVLWLGERVGRWRWAGIVIGYAGVLVH